MLISSLHPTPPWRGASCPRPGQTFFREPPSRIVYWMSYVISESVRPTRTLERPPGHVSEPVRPRRMTQTLGATARGSAITRYSSAVQADPPPRHGSHSKDRCRTALTRSPSQTGRRPPRKDHFVSDTTDLMGARVEETAAAPSTDASAPATGAGPRRRQRYRPRGHGAGRAAAGRIRPRHQGHRADAQEPADRGHQGGAGRGRSPRQGRACRCGRRRRDQAEAPQHLPVPYGRRGPRREGGEGRQGREEGGQDGRRQGRRPAADRHPRPAVPKVSPSADQAGAPADDALRAPSSPGHRRRRAARPQPPRRWPVETKSEPKADSSAPQQSQGHQQGQGDARSDGEGGEGRRRDRRDRGDRGP